METRTNSRRDWLFRGLVAIAAGLMIASAISTWWTCDVFTPYMGDMGTIKIYQYGLLHAPPEIEEDITPFYQTVLAWVYIAVSVGLMLYSTWLRGRKGRLLLGGIGLIYIAYAAIAAFIVISGRIADFGGVLQGYTEFNYEILSEAVELTTSLRFGYYLAYVAGGACLVLALLRNIIVGKPKISK